MADNPTTNQNTPATQTPTATTTKDATNNMGPIDRFMDPWMSKAFTALAPEGQENKWLGHYRNNRSLYNFGALGVGALGAAHLANGMYNAFNPPPQQPQQPAYGGGVGSWMLPLAALGVGGAYLWNKYGDKITTGVQNLQQLSEYAPRIKKFMDNPIVKMMS